MFQGLIKKPSSSSSSSFFFAKIEGFTEKERIALFQAGRIRKVEDGEYIIHKGETCSVLTLVLEGPFEILLGLDSDRSAAVSGGERDDV